MATRARGLQQAYDLRDLTHEKAMELAGLPAKDIGGLIAQLVRSWDVGCERIRLMRGRPLPGSLSPSERKRRPRARQVQVDSPDAPDAPGNPE